MSDSAQNQIQGIRQYKYIGWIPCIAGKLAFKLNFCSLKSSGLSFHINHLEQSPSGQDIAHYILISSTYNWKDSGHIEEDGLFRVLFIADKLERDKSLKCHVYLMRESAASEQWHHIDKILAVIKEITVNESTQNVHQSYQRLKHELNKLSTNPLMYEVVCEIDQRGFVTLSYCNNGFSYADDHEFTVCRQANYYIKYAFHKHQHHAKSSEALTTIHLIPQEKNEIGELLIDDLRFSLVALKQNFEPAEYYALYKAKGIASYALSLIESCRAEDYISQEGYSRELAYIKNMESSLQSHADNMDKALLRSMNSQNKTRAIILFGLSIIAPLTILFKEKIMSYLGGTNIPAENPRYPDHIVAVLGTIFATDRSVLITAALIATFMIFHRIINERYSRLTFALSFFRNWLAPLINAPKESPNATIVSWTLIVIGSAIMLMLIWSLYQ